MPGVETRRSHLTPSRGRHAYLVESLTFEVTLERRNDIGRVRPHDRSQLTACTGTGRNRILWTFGIAGNHRDDLEAVPREHSLRGRQTFFTPVRFDCRSLITPVDFKTVERGAYRIREATLGS